MCRLAQPSGPISSQQLYAFELPMQIPVCRTDQDLPTVTVDRLGIPSGDARVVLGPGNLGSPALDVRAAAVRMLATQGEGRLAADSTGGSRTCRCECCAKRPSEDVVPEAQVLAHTS